MDHTDCTCGRESCIRRLEQKRRETAYLNKHMKGVTIHVSIPQSFKNDLHLFYLLEKRIDEAFSIGNGDSNSIGNGDSN